MIHVNLGYLSAGKHFRLEDDIKSKQYEIIMWKDYTCHFIDENGKPGEIDTEHEDPIVFTGNWANTEDDAIKATERDWKWYERDKGGIVSESIVPYLNEDKIKGGKGDNTKPSEVCPKQLDIGRIVEKEHTTDSKIAEEIALDHLTENEKYYTELVEKGIVDELPAIRKYVHHFGEAKLPTKYKKMLKK